MFNLDNFYKKDDNYIEVIDYSNKGFSKKAIYHDGDSSEKIYVIHKNYQPYENAYFYNGLAVICLGKIENLNNWGAFKKVVPTNSYCVVNKNLDVIVKDEELDSKGFALKPSTIFKLVKNYGVGALQILKPEMFLVKDFEIVLNEYFDLYCQNKKNKNIDDEKIAFKKIIDDAKEQVLENENNI